jgi:hypothetical protein
MKKFIVTTTVCCLIFAAFVAGQNQTKEKRIENCCCKHTQQIAEDLHWIRTSMSKPFVPPDILLQEFPDEPKELEKLSIPPFKIPDINSPKPKKR